ncbi:uncharacterized protein IWZ02DRAFT_104968 [Phyllosticta citriasiana]|uniref:uncharacterized protein n=1 Tax=Phyllosticta citriasiana TaxID=595635 RepID=UPI0030FD9F8E
MKKRDRQTWGENGIRVFCLILSRVFRLVLLSYLLEETAAVVTAHTSWTEIDNDGGGGVSVRWSVVVQIRQCDGPSIQTEHLARLEAGFGCGLVLVCFYDFPQCVDRWLSWLSCLCGLLPALLAGNVSIGGYVCLS